MITKSKTGFAFVAAASFVASLAVGAFVVTAIQTPAEAPEHQGAHAAWVSTAESVPELAQEADLIVRVQALRHGDPRYLWSPAPAGAEIADGRSTFVFTDTEVEILEVYGGKARVGDRLWVLQTGGELVNRSGDSTRLELAEDPLYRSGDEMVLFLINISNDPVHAQGRALYRAVNPNGRFQVEGSLVSRSLLGDPSKSRQQLDLGALEDAIHTAGRF